MEYLKAKQVIAQYCIEHDLIYFSTPAHGKKLRRTYSDLTPGLIGKVTRDFLKIGIFKKISKRRYKFEKDKCEDNPILTRRTFD